MDNSTFQKFNLLVYMSQRNTKSQKTPQDKNFA